MSKHCKGFVSKKPNRLPLSRHRSLRHYGYCSLPQCFHKIIIDTTAWFYMKLSIFVAAWTMRRWPRKAPMSAKACPQAQKRHTFWPAVLQGRENFLQVLPGISLGLFPEGQNTRIEILGCGLHELIRYCALSFKSAFLNSFSPPSPSRVQKNPFQLIYFHKPIGYKYRSMICSMKLAQ